MPRFDDAEAWMRAAREHVDTTGHEVIQADNLVERMLGFTCLDCSTVETTWELPVRFVQELPPLCIALASRNGRAGLLRVINTNSRNPSTWPVMLQTFDLLPQEEIQSLSLLWGGTEERELLQRQEEQDRQARERHHEEMRAVEEAARPTRFERDVTEED